MKPEFIEARDLPDAWFQCVYRLLETGREYTVGRGSYQGQKRLEFDYVTIHIRYPGVRPLLPDIPPTLGIPNPVAEGYLEQYLPYLMTSARMPGEEYTYTNNWPPDRKAGNVASAETFFWSIAGVAALLLVLGFVIPATKLEAMGPPLPPPGPDAAPLADFTAELTAARSRSCSISTSSGSTASGARVIDCSR